MRRQFSTAGPIAARVNFWMTNTTINLRSADTIGRRANDSLGAGRFHDGS